MVSITIRYNEVADRHRDAVDGQIPYLPNERLANGETPSNCGEDSGAISCAAEALAR